MKILIVEDSLLQATQIQILLKRYSVDEVYTAYNGEDAIELCKKHRFDIAFCDLQLPQIDGVSLLASSEAQGSIQTVVILSAMADAALDSTKSMCKLIGYNEVEAIPKPVDETHIQRLLSSYKRIQTAKSILPTEVKLDEQQTIEAFENEWFTNAYQTQHDVEQSTLVGVEVLARIMHPELGLLTPFHFMDTLRQLGLMDRLFFTVLELALKDISSMRKPIHFAINIEQSTLKLEIADQVASLCDKYKIDPSLLTLEITEHETILLDAHCYKNIAKLSMLGVGLSVDDFGTGYASLSQLSSLPFTELKVDRSFVNNISENKKNQILTKACINLAENLGLSCIVEGVEQQQDLEYLKTIGMTKYQGFITSKPASFSEFTSVNNLK
ncbi:EAL domain-containing protein (putative c-di-GMP-specific phosphodiesterase class I) [Vibrio crassostreae]|uniref:EAL domain-containing response regulator n=1 Tax=Vibrio crassostreae TaxID=246167 RepID=UPI000F481C9E|nr:EAL domain-containing protein [Vibrio crassostreae]ROO76148.1 EAL domain-containing protein (putative c-di-GMP-specific phosphodiesterase class I) [Vibrio crassostreae]ROP14158.1 EAL domain-containing protein (putative c-di-GMP-specific phosphodiesterase class I) [Vibrio crassostreae]RPE94608.1 EAL domain-containing protein (putative c-di-GMP-specific phosphodiesterase class I) [Vibrio crassostreae]RPF17347.1 EAL domain-containing protein (putative c-di-GMP-specific phosphodiesterase class I